MLHASMAISESGRGREHPLSLPLVGEHKKLDPGLKLAEGRIKSARGLQTGIRRIGYSPVNDLRAPGPGWRNSERGPGPNCYNEIHPRRVGSQKLITTLALEAVAPQVVAPKKTSRDRMNGGCGQDARTVGAEFGAAPAGEQRLGHDAANRVIRTQKEHVADLVISGRFACRHVPELRTAGLRFALTNIHRDAGLMVRDSMLLRKLEQRCGHRIRQANCACNRPICCFLRQL